MGASFDHADCVELAFSVWQHDAQAALDRIDADVCRFIRRADVWAAIETLAARLLERRTVSGRMARSILRQFIARRRRPTTAKTLSGNSITPSSTSATKPARETQRALDRR